MIRAILRHDGGETGMDHNSCTAEGNITRQIGLRSAMAIAIRLLTAVWLLCHLGCTSAVNHGKENGIDTAPAYLRDILITGTGDNIKIEIILSKSLNYKIYNIVEPPREVVDLSPAALNPFRTPLDVKSSLISRIDIIKSETDGHPVTRIIFKLKHHVEFSAVTDPSDNKKIVLTVVQEMKNPAANLDKTAGTPSQAGHTGNLNTTRKAENKSGIAPAPVKPAPSSGIKTASSTAKPASPLANPAGRPPYPETENSYQAKPGKIERNNADMIVRGIDITQNGICIAVNGAGENFRYFRLSAPQRLVIDVFGAKNAVENRLVSINRFGIRSVRLGTYPDKVRIVFDASGKIFPSCRIEAENRGITVLFEKK